MKVGDLLCALIDEDAFDVFGHKRSIKSRHLYMAEEIDNLFGFVKLDGFDGAVFSKSSFDVLEDFPIIDEWNEAEPTRVYKEGITTGRFTHQGSDLEINMICRHLNKRKNYVMKFGVKETFYYCPDCKEEVCG